MVSILIKNGLVYDGSETQPFKSDILVHNDRIIRLGFFNKTDAKNVIDASQAIVAPGFIDINSRIDCNFAPFSESFQDNCLRQGITTALGGNGGVSLAPASGASFNFIKDWFGVSGINANWHSVKDFLNFLERKRLKINFGTLVGQTSSRFFVTGKGRIRDLTEKELFRFKNIVSRALDDGAFGISAVLSRFYPTKFNAKEIYKLAEIAAAKKKVLALNLRTEDIMLQRTEREIIDIAEKTGASVEINGLNPSKPAEKFYLRLKDAIEKETAKVHIDFDCHSLEHSTSPIYEFLPSGIKNEEFEKMIEAAHSKHFEKQLLAHLKKYEPEEMKIYDAPKPFDFLIGKNLKELAAVFNLNFAEMFLKLMKITRLKTVIVRRNVDSETQKVFLCSKNSLIASHDFYFGNENFSPFLNFLKLSGVSPCFSFEKALAKITSIPAQKYGIKKRGRIAENYYADIVILRNSVPSEILLNGKVVMEEKEIKKVSEGRILKSEKHN